MVANNKKALFDYFIEDKYEAGISLAGTEVKSLRMGKCSIKEAFIRIEKGEVYVYNMHISPYEKGNIFNKDPLRPKKLLMHKKEILKLQQKIWSPYLSTIHRICLKKPRMSLYQANGNISRPPAATPVCATISCFI